MILLYLHRMEQSNPKETKSFSHNLDEECIENFISKELRRHDPVIYLPNGHRLVMFYAKNLAFAINEGEKKEDRVMYVLKLDPAGEEGFFVEKFTYHEFWLFDMAVRSLLDIPGDLA